jgi:hypothetical protein
MVGSNEIRASAVPNRVQSANAASEAQPAFVAGLLSASVAAALFTQWQVSRTFAPAALFIIALAYVSAVTLAGAVGSWFYWNSARTNSIGSLRDFILQCSAAWVWMPAVVLLIEQNSLWAAPLVALGAAALASSLHRIVCAESNSEVSFQRSREKELFAESLELIRWDWHASVISICMYAAFFALRDQAILAACASVAVGVFLLAGQLSSTSKSNRAHALWRMVAAGFVATLITTATLWVGVRGKGYGPLNGIANARGHGFGDAAPRQNDQSPVEERVGGGYGYRSIILWPLPPKKEIIAPLPEKASLLGVKIVKPLDIPFDGSYWYFQPPETRPSFRTHVAHGDPLEVNIHSTNFEPLLMEAHQNLATAIRITRCREIQVAIENRDNRPGLISIGMQLTDSTSAGKPTLYLGQQPILSSEPDHFRIKRSPVEETLLFSVPSHSTMHRFNQITLIVTPDRARVEIGAKVAIQQFEILPR